MCEAEPLCAENIGLKDIARRRRGKLISQGELIMYYSSRKYINSTAHVSRLSVTYDYG